MFQVRRVINQGPGEYSRPYYSDFVGLVAGVLVAVRFRVAVFFADALEDARLGAASAGVGAGSAWAALIAAQRFRIASPMAFRPAALSLRFRLTGGGAAASVAGP